MKVLVFSIIILIILLASCKQKILDGDRKNKRPYYRYINKMNDKITFISYFKHCNSISQPILPGDTLMIKKDIKWGCENMIFEKLDSVDIVFSDQKKLRMKRNKEDEKLNTIQIFNLSNYQKVEKIDEKWSAYINVYYYYTIDNRIYKMAK